MRIVGCRGVEKMITEEKRRREERNGGEGKGRGKGGRDS